MVLNWELLDSLKKELFCWGKNLLLKGIGRENTGCWKENLCRAIYINARVFTMDLNMNFKKAKIKCLWSANSAIETSRNAGVREKLSIRLYPKKMIFSAFSLNYSAYTVMERLKLHIFSKEDPRHAICDREKQFLSLRFKKEQHRKNVENHW